MRFQGCRMEVDDGIANVAVKFEPLQSLHHDPSCLTERGCPLSVKASHPLLGIHLQIALHQRTYRPNSGKKGATCDDNVSPSVMQMIGSLGARKLQNDLANWGTRTPKTYARPQHIQLQGAGKSLRRGPRARPIGRVF